MKRSLHIVAGLLCCFLMGQSILPTEAAQKTEEEKNYIETMLEAEDVDVTLTVNIQEESQVTSGRIAVYYDADLLELSETKIGNLWKAEDVNEEITEDEKAGLSYAWADTRKLTEQGNLITVSFQALDKADGQKVSVETRVLELYSEQTALVPAWKKKTDTVKIHFHENEDKPNNQEDNQEEDSGKEDEKNEEGDEKSKEEDKKSKEEDEKSKEQESASAVQTGDDTNLAGWILAALGAVLVIVDVGKKYRVNL